MSKQALPVLALGLVLAAAVVASLTLEVDDRTLTYVALGIVFIGALLPGVSLDLVAILSLVLLVVGGVLTAQQAAHGFGNPTLLTVACMFVVAAALQHTGAVEFATGLIHRAGRTGLRRLFLVFLPFVMVLSALMNNTGVVVLLLPVLLSASRDLEVPPSRLLMPLSYAAILGGTLTLVGTTTNLLVDGIVRQEGFAGLSLLQFIPMGLVFSGVGLAYCVLVAPHALPDRVGLATLVPRPMRSDYLTEVVLGADSPLVGQTLREVAEGMQGVRLLQLVRGEETFWPPFLDLPLQPGDLLLAKGAPEDIVTLLRQRGLVGPPEGVAGERVSGVNLDLGEVMIPPGSTLSGTTVSAAGLRERYGVVVLGVLRHGAHLREHLGSLPLRVGDILLVQGAERDLEHLAVASDLLPVGGPPPRAPHRHKALLASLTSLAALGLAAVEVLALPMAVLLAAVVLVAGGCLSSGQAYRSVNLHILVILGCMLGVGLAVEKSGIAQDVAATLVETARAWAPAGYEAMGMLAAIYLATMVLTEAITNAGTAAVMVPIALEVAGLEGLNYLPFVMAVALAASCSLLTPIGYQTNLLVYGPGGYRFWDYFRFGLPLSLSLWIAGTALLPLIFPF